MDAPAEVSCIKCFQRAICHFVCDHPVRCCWFEVIPPPPDGGCL